MPKLTVKTVAAIRAPDPSGKQRLHWDTEMKGFGVLVSGVASTKMFVVQRTLGPRGKTRRVTIGSVSTMTLEQARDQAAAMIEQLRLGVDPKAKNPDDMTLQEGLTAYLAARKDLRPASIRAYKQIERNLSAWLQTKLRDITPEMCEQKHRSLAADVGEFTANYNLRVLRIIYNFCADRTPMPPNPVKRLKRQWYAEPRRTGIVRSAEMPKFYRAVMAMDNEIARDYVLTLMYTGMRKTETALLTWDDIDFTERVIRVQAATAKSTRKLDLPMCNEVRDILVARRALGRTQYVFPGGGKTGRLWDPGLSKVGEACGIKATAHWMKRGYVTIAESLDISPYALKVLVAHSVGKDVTGGYVVFSTERLREASQKIADRITKLCEVPVVGDGNVARLGQ